MLEIRGILTMWRIKSRCRFVALVTVLRVISKRVPGLGTVLLVNLRAAAHEVFVLRLMASHGERRGELVWLRQICLFGSINNKRSSDLRVDLSAHAPIVQIHQHLCFVCDEADGNLVIGTM